MQSIFSRADACEELLRQAVDAAQEQQSALLQGIEDFQRRFAAWWQSLGVFSQPRSNLDHRLREQPTIHSIVLRVLGILSTSISDLISSLRLRVDNGSEQAVKDGTEAPEIADAIDASLNYLAQIGTAIRHSSKTTETTRARRYAASHLDTTTFQVAALEGITAMYPNAPKSLRLQLSDSILDRHVRIKYRKFRHQRLETDSRQATVFPQEERVRRPATEDNEPRAVTENRQPAAQPVDADFDFATTVDRSQFHKNLKPRPPVLQPTIPGVSATTVVLNDSSAYEPPTPIQDDFQNACCDWCFKPLNFNFFENEGKRWSRFGRSHYRRDLEPFVCLAEKCSQERPSFHSTKDWRAHMRSHTQTWTQTIHCAPRWGCPLSKDTPATAIDPEGLLHMGPVYFSTYDELRSHLGAMHKEAALGIDDELLEHPATTSQRALTECVLCGFVVDHGKETQASKASSHKRDSTMTKSPLPPAKKRNVQWANDSADITLPTRNVEPQLQATEIPIGARVSNEAPMVTLAIASTTTRAFIERGQSIDAGTSAIEDPPLDNLQTQEIMEEHILLHLNNIFQFGLRLMEGEKNVRGATEDGKSVEPDEPVSSAKTRLLSATSAGLPSLNYNSEPELEPPADIAHTATTDGVEISRDQLWHQHFLSVGYDQIPPLESLNSYLDDITGVIEHPGAVGDIPSPNFRMGLSLNEDWSFVPLRDPDASLSHSEIVNTGVNPLDYKHYS